MKLSTTLSWIMGILFTCLPIEFPILPFMDRPIEIWPRIYAYYNWLILYFIGVLCYYFTHYIVLKRRTWEFKTNKVDFILSIVLGSLFTAIPYSFPIVPFMQDLITLFPSIEEYYNYVILYTIGSSLYYCIRYYYKANNSVDKPIRDLQTELKDKLK